MNDHNDYERDLKEDIASIQQQTSEQLHLTADEVHYIKERIRRERQSLRMNYKFGVGCVSIILISVVLSIVTSLMANQLLDCSIFSRLCVLAILIPVLLNVRKRMND